MYVVKFLLKTISILSWMQGIKDMQHKRKTFSVYWSYEEIKNTVSQKNLLRKKDKLDLFP